MIVIEQKICQVTKAFMERPKCKKVKLTSFILVHEVKEMIKA